MRYQPWKKHPLGQGQANMPLGDPLLREPGEYQVDVESSGSQDPLGHALFEFKGKTYLATFPARDPRDVEFVELDRLPWYKAQQGNPN